MPQTLEDFEDLGPYSTGLGSVDLDYLLDREEENQLPPVPASDIPVIVLATEVKSILKGKRGGNILSDSPRYENAPELALNSDEVARRLDQVLKAVEKVMEEPADEQSVDPDRLASIAKEAGVGVRTPQEGLSSEEEYLSLQSELASGIYGCLRTENGVPILRYPSRYAGQTESGQARYEKYPKLNLGRSQIAKLVRDVLNMVGVVIGRKGKMSGVPYKESEPEAATRIVLDFKESEPEIKRSWKSFFAQKGEFYSPEELAEYFYCKYRGPFLRAYSLLITLDNDKVYIDNYGDNSVQTFGRGEVNHLEKLEEVKPEMISYWA